MLCAALLSQAPGQSVLGVSFPFGVPVQENSGMSLSMGGTANAAASDQNIMLRNPANLGTIDRTVYSALYSFDYTRISASSSHVNLFSSFPTQLSFGIPLGAVGTMAFSFTQKSDRKTEFQVDTSLVFNSLSVSGSRGFVTGGGLVAWQAGWGRSFGRWCQLGLGYERLYFSTDQTILSTTNDEVNGAASSRDSSDISSRIDGIRFGLAVPVRAWRIGLSGEYFFNAGTTVSRGVYANASTVPVSGSSQNTSFTLRLPPSLTLGVSYDISPEWLVASDLSAVFWDRYDSEGMLADATDASALGFSAGAQYIPAPNLLTPRYWETIRYRAGLRFNQLPSGDSREFMGSLGLGLPIGHSTGILDIAIEAGTRTSNRFPGLSENVVHIGLGISGGHKWTKSSRGNY